MTTENGNMDTLITDPEPVDSPPAEFLDPEADVGDDELVVSEATDDDVEGVEEDTLDEPVADDEAGDDGDEDTVSDWPDPDELDELSDEELAELEERLGEEVEEEEEGDEEPSFDLDTASEQINTLGEVAARMYQKLQEQEKRLTELSTVERKLEQLEKALELDLFEEEQGDGGSDGPSPEEVAARHEQQINLLVEEYGESEFRDVAPYMKKLHDGGADYRDMYDLYDRAVRLRDKKKERERSSRRKVLKDRLRKKKRRTTTAEGSNKRPVKKRKIRNTEDAFQAAVEELGFF